jgi:hypothetical protein
MFDWELQLLAYGHVDRADILPVLLKSAAPK